ncbi:MAG: hypothetical protein K2M87_00835 [Muribaculaceae bacterium]|nr:hypothetical protein [Muribaculaceae bacterium]
MAIVIITIVNWNVFRIAKVSGLSSTRALTVAELLLIGDFMAQSVSE